MVCCGLWVFFFWKVPYLILICALPGMWLKEAQFAENRNYLKMDSWWRDKRDQKKKKQNQNQEHFRIPGMPG